MSTTFRNRLNAQTPGGLKNDPENPIATKSRGLSQSNNGLASQKPRLALGDIRNVNSSASASSKKPELKKGLSISNANQEKGQKTPIAPRSNLISNANNTLTRSVPRMKQRDAVPVQLKESWAAFAEDSDEEEIDTCHKPRERRTSLEYASEDYYGPKEERVSSIPSSRWNDMYLPPGIVTDFESEIDAEAVMKELEEMGLFG